MFERNCTRMDMRQRAFWVGNNTGKKQRSKLHVISASWYCWTYRRDRGSNKALSAGRAQTTKSLVY